MFFFTPRKPQATNGFLYVTEQIIFVLFEAFFKTQLFPKISAEDRILNIV